ncbi:MAG: ribosome-binding factor A [Elusimicrobia bacterium CG1_02_63_36]|nr:MAG: ribosome-binding factor A [Elusimicrobia bacterium CG1_02_63_36]PIP82423.1 MAG: ribosome-binding factor A [Elusimicrobia bacterium CG22_combo_CG10-13_8_21_14_all_63_91]PJA17873.1 MAG: ribosome-binding factor A [Elusimicrobia bacterium CG_4_10_14_0_2_um_filter_63_34]PJB26571.1 MAG: ribosome-binding factor A [Elusimicrobia bacterium CG_4_9_14_3_um_filter_62_55]
MASNRGIRLRELFLQELTSALRDVKDPGLSGFLTITDLELAKDKKTARVYFSVLGTPEDLKKTERALERSSAFLRQTIRARLRLRTVPHFVFVFDDTPSRANRIERLIDDLNRGEHTPRPAPELEEKMLGSIASREGKKRRKRGR